VSAEMVNLGQRLFLATVHRTGHLVRAFFDNVDAVHLQLGVRHGDADVVFLPWELSALGASRVVVADLIVTGVTGERAATLASRDSEGHDVLAAGELAGLGVERVEHRLVGDVLLPDLTLVDVGLENRVVDVGDFVRCERHFLDPCELTPDGLP